MKHLLLLTLFVLISISSLGQNKPMPTGLMTDLIEHTDRVWENGYLTTKSLEQVGDVGPAQMVRIGTSQPSFSWIVDNAGKSDVMQTAYRIIVSKQLDSSLCLIGNVWESGRVESNQSISVRHQGKPLESNQVYYWRVKYWDNHGRESEWSKPKGFMTSSTLEEYHTPYYPLQKSDQTPLTVKAIPNGYFADFGKAAFGQVRITLTSHSIGDSIVVHTGERINNGRVERIPAGTTRYNRFVVQLLPGKHTYQLDIPSRPMHLKPMAVKMPEYIGEVAPFRYLEVEGYSHPLGVTDVVRQMVHYPINESAVEFTCSDTIVNQVWELCRYSMKATSFAGLFVDGDRERIPYEADALINQLSYYCVDREYSIARRTHEFLLYHPTWPTEWILQSILIAWNDYMYSGDSRALEAYYEQLKIRTLMQCTQSNDLISMKLHPQTKSFRDSLYYVWDKPINDIVDWPWPGGFGMGENNNGETDQFEFTDYNTVVNAYHYEALRQLAIIADVLHRKEESKQLSSQADRVKLAVNRLLFDRKRGVYKDGITTNHASLHGNMFPLAFGMVDERWRESVTRFVRSRGMACSVYGSQFLMDAVYNGFDDEYGLSLLRSTDLRSWYNMIRVGSTITLEAWDDRFKPNQDWNHAWGAVPANVIARKMMGVEPLEAGFSRIRLRPQIGSLEYAEGKFPTIRGDVKVRVENLFDRYLIKAVLPANTETEVWLPVRKGQSNVSRNGIVQQPKKDLSGQFWIISHVGSGEQQFEVW